jgi:hypothetical protein
MVSMPTSLSNPGNTILSRNPTMRAPTKTKNHPTALVHVSFIACDASNSIYWDKPVDQRQTEVSLFMSLVLRPAQDLGKHIFKPESAPNWQAPFESFLGLISGCVKTN